MTENHQQHDTITSNKLALTLFHIFVCLAAIYPRLPNDRPFPFTIGGHLSNSFRKILLIASCGNVFRLIFMSDVRVDADHAWLANRQNLMRYIFFLFLSVFESFILSFLCLITPYLMRCQLQNKINIAQPGQDLMIWVYFVLIINVLGFVVVAVKQDISFWWIKKVGDALGFVPVYKTLKLYNSIMTQGGKYPGRGDMTGQAFLMIEYLVLIGTLLSAVGYISTHSEYKQVMEAFRVFGAYAFMTRILCHSMLLNSKDEADYLHTFATASPSSNDDVNETSQSEQEESITTRMLVSTKAHV
jgi:hypothetical protein